MRWYLVLSEVIPLDDQYRTREFLMALPLPSLEDGYIWLMNQARQEFPVRPAA